MTDVGASYAIAAAMLAVAVALGLVILGGRTRHKIWVQFRVRCV